MEIVEKWAFRQEYEKNKPPKQKVMKEIIDSLKKLGVTLGIAGTVGTGSAFADISYNNGGYTKAVVDALSDKDTPEAQAPKKQTVNPEKTANFNDFVKPQDNEGKKFEGGNGEPNFSIENGVLRVEGGNDKLQKAVDAFNNLQNQELKDLTLKYIEQVMNDGNLEDRQKRMTITSLLQAALGENTMQRGDAEGPYTDAYKAIREMAENPANVDEEGNVRMDYDYSEYAQYGDGEWTNTAVEQSEKELADAQKRLEETMKLENQSKEKVLEAARAYVATGGNPADLQGWEEFAKRYNITPDDL